MSLVQLSLADLGRSEVPALWEVIVHGIRKLPDSRLCALAVEALSKGATATYRMIRTEQKRREDYYTSAFLFAGTLKELA